MELIPMIEHYIYIYMVGVYFNHLEKYESQWEGLSHILWKKCLKPPTRYIYIYIYIWMWVKMEDLGDHRC